jgi:hypothetical protein
MSPSLDTHVIGPGHLMAGVDDTARPAGMGYTGIDSHQSATGTATPSEQAAPSAVRNADCDLRIKVSKDLLADAAMAGIDQDIDASPPSPGGLTPSTSSTQPVAASAPMTEKPFAYLRSVIGG